MDRRIIIYGNSDRREGQGFQTADDFIDYIRAGVFEQYGGRYQYSQNKKADVIVLSREGLIYGRFDIEGQEKPSEADVALYDLTKCVYLVCRSAVYETPVPLADVGIDRIQFGKAITEEQLQDIETRAGMVTTYPR